MELRGQTIIITGASSGIGAAAAELFAIEGANVVLGARREPELHALTNKITQNGGAATYLAGDVTQETYATALVEHALNTFGSFHGAFNNAGMMGEMVPLPQMDSANWNDVLTTNLTSAFYAAKAQIPALKSNGSGSIVFTSSFVGALNSGMPGMGAYAASKAGLVGLVKSLAAEHGPDSIRINALLPGGTRTAMAGDDPEGHTFISNLHPLKRMAEPLEIAEAALFLLSKRSSFVTGGAMAADGGVSVRLI
ncbi:SDR family oxidoreductase [Flexibacterium corallicola]|uniref:SDR family oxidoreductase n=1 Tax=Flexibacterium corallicola TaxID=3037259 RepID=UPI00286ECB5E|nr:SDR family oxidoreductase [Pseudovibrio sp. M1P-2-3]